MRAKIFKTGEKIFTFITAAAKVAGKIFINNYL